MTEDEMGGWHHQLKACKSEQTPGDTEGQGSLACCSPWGCEELDTTQRLNNKNCYKQLYANKRGNIEEVDTFLET